MSGSTSFSELTAARQALVRLCQSINYGLILDLHVRDREPAFSPVPTVLRDIKLDLDDNARAETDLADFVLRDEVRRLLDQIDSMAAGRIQRIEVQAGIRAACLSRRTSWGPRDEYCTLCNRAGLTASEAPFNHRRFLGR